MKDCPNQQTRINKIFQWKSKDKEWCSLCPNMKSHKFIRCDVLCKICADNNWTEDLVKTKLRNQLFAKKKQQQEESSKPGVAAKHLDKKVAARKAELEASGHQFTPDSDNDSAANSQDTGSMIESHNE